MIDPARRGEASPTSPQSNGGDAMDELRTLLLGPEQEEIVHLKRRLDSVRLSADKIGELLPDAVSSQTDKGQRLTRALLPSVEKAIEVSVRRNPKVLVDSLFPVMGPAIRKAIAAAISGMVQSLNETLEHSFSLRGLKWRVESMRTGKPFGEIVLLHSLRYRVEQVFLIHRESGLLLQHVTAGNQAAQDPDMVSGMLTAIRDFAKDSFAVKQEETVNTMQVGNLTVMVEDGPYAVVAAVVRGSAPEELRTLLQEALERIHSERGEELKSFVGDTDPFEHVRPHLEECLIFQYASRPRKSSPVLVLLLIVLIGALAFWGVLYAQRTLRWNRYVESLNGQQGILITEAGKQDGKFFISGLRDPLAVDPSKLLVEARVEPNQVISRWEPYQALTPELVLARSKAFLQPPDSVQLHFANGVLSARGSAPHAWIADARRIAPVIFGVQKWDERDLEDEDAALLRSQKDRIEKTIVRFRKGTAELIAGEEQALREVVNALLQLNADAREARLAPYVMVFGHADSEGAEEANILLSRARGEFVRQSLVFRGYPSENVRSEGVGSSKPLRAESSEEEKQFNRSASFQIQFENLKD